MVQCKQCDSWPLWLLSLLGGAVLTETPVFVHNSVVCVGGDGMFSEILHGLIGRTQQEAGLCENDPTVALQPCPLHIGIIPAGKDSAIHNLSEVGLRAVTAQILCHLFSSRFHRLCLLRHSGSD